jgi:outer membrane protein OmpA-like peptidoglycan-associated protein
MLGEIVKGALKEQLIAWSPFIAIGFIAFYLLMPSPIQDRVILLPGPDGSVGEVVVTSAAGEQVLNSAYAGVGANAQGRLVSKTESPDSVTARYGSTLDARPLRPQSFTVYFVSGSATELHADSRSIFEVIKSVLAGRPAAEIVVIGHTDTVGELEANDALSAERAATMRDQLVAAGIPAASMEVAGRGEREPLVKTDDGVDEPRNRRVEISVR